MSETIVIHTTGDAMDALKGAQHWGRTAKSQQNEVHGSCPFSSVTEFIPFLHPRPQVKPHCESFHSKSSSAIGNIEHCEQGLCSLELFIHSFSVPVKHY